jgi:(p)ppGpp synthase/HD superfamily hydrolase
MSFSFAKLQQAVAFAARAHHGQLRKDGRTPYASHPFRVCLVACELFGVHDPEILTAAVLHDTIEDTTTDYDDVAAAFGTNVAEWVRLLSKDKRLPEAEREEAYVHGLVNAEWQVQLLKCADICDNLCDLDQLPAERRPQSLTRMKFYLDRMQAKLMPEAQAAFTIALTTLRARMA